jgi:ADP-heptose:LPS heptosyltransferase
MTGLPALRAVRRALPAHRLGTTCPSWLVPLARALDAADFYVCEDVNGDFDIARHQDVDADVLREVMRSAPDVVVALRVPKAGRTEALADLAAGTMVGFRHDWVEATAGHPPFDDGEHVLARWSRLLRAFGIPSRVADLHPDVRLDTVVHVGAGSPARQWPVVRWAEVARTLAEDGHDVVFTGSPSEAELVERTRRLAGLGPTTDLSGGCTALELAGLIQRARLVLSTDTGVSHLATAFRRPSVTVFGPTSPVLWGPPDSPLHPTLWAGLSGDPYAPEPFPGLLDIAVADVLSAASSALSAQEAIG